MSKFMNKVKTLNDAVKVLGFSKNTFKRVINISRRKISIEFLVKLIRYLNNKNFTLGKAEKKILWIGHKNSKGIINPKLPFNFNSKQSVRTLAAIFNEGWISGGMYYSNSEKPLRDSVKKSTLEAFGGNQETIKEYLKENDKVLAFPSIFRDLFLTYVNFKGSKVTNDPKIPNEILSNKELMCAWLEQTIADEGSVIFNPQKPKPEKYKKLISWKRSMDVTNYKPLQNIKKNTPFKKLPFNVQTELIRRMNNIMKFETEILKRLDINFRHYCGNVYLTKDKIRIRKVIHITKRKNLLKLRKIITIPHPEKELKFKEMFNDYKRYKEPLKVKNSIIELGIKKKHFTSIDLKHKMKYQNLSNSFKWLKIFEKEGLIKKIKESSYGNGYYREPARYILNQTSKAVPET